MTKTKIASVKLSGGIIGILTTNQRNALESAIVQYNNEGWRCHQVLADETRNLFIKLLQGAVLVCTLFLWTWGNGYLLLLERDQ